MLYLKLRLMFLPYQTLILIIKSMVFPLKAYFVLAQRAKIGSPKYFYNVTTKIMSQ